MKKIFYSLSFIFLLLLSIIIIVLSIPGYETDRFNNLIENKVTNQNKNFSITLEKIKFKIDLKNLSLFIETNNPNLSYNNISIPVKSIKIYLDFLSTIKSDTQINQINIQSKEIEVSQFKKILIKTKPSNLNSLINNKVQNGKIIVNFELYFKENLSLENFIAKGEVNGVDVEISDSINLKDTSFNFFSDNTDILIKNITGKLDGFLLKEGSLQIEKDKNIAVNSNFLSKVNLNEKNIGNYLKFLKDYKFLNKKIILNADLNHNLNIVFDKTFKVLNYSLSSRGKVDNLELYLMKPIKSNFLNNSISNIDFKNSDFNFRVGSDKKNYVNAEGSYSIDKNTYQTFKIENSFLKKNLQTKLNFKFLHPFQIDLLNYKKQDKTEAEFFIDLKTNKDLLFFKTINYSEDRNVILVNNLKIKKSNLVSLKELKVKTLKNDVIKNDFKLQLEKKIKIVGKKYDATNLNKIINQKSSSDLFKKINKEINISFKVVETPLSKKLRNFNLIGKLDKGKFTKISSKGDFGNNKFLDISLKSDKKNNKKYLEIYSDLPQPLLSEYKFFKGLTDGTLTFSSFIDKNTTNSKLLIENFKIKNAPGVVKLLSLADFGGLADLAEGEGLSFEKLEMKLSKDNENFLKIEELYAVGPSISVLMEGYQDSNGLTSLRGTLVPAKNLNKLLSKIPVIGDIIIPKEVGEGLFGVSFKIKGPSGKIKTSINPIKTLTPRFITKALEKSKGTK